MPESVYPGANRTTRYWPNGGGVLQPAIDKLVLHSTETKSLPSYRSGTIAPSLTVNPWPGKQNVWQHFKSVAMSAKALRDTGGFAENRDNVAQIEIIGYSDPAQKDSGYFLPNLPPEGVAYLGEVLAWFAREWGVPLIRPKLWPAFPASYGKTSARMSQTAYDAFKGVLGHLHVPDNTHGDPTIDIDAVLAAAQGKYTPPKLGDRVLSKDGTDSGPDVVELIERLNARGYGLMQDGLFGPAVEEAVREFQGARGLVVDGIVGPRTAAALLDVEPLPEPEPEPDGLVLSVASLNFEAKQWGGTKYISDAKWVMANLKPDVIFTQETEEVARNQMVRVSGFKVYPENYVALYWNDELFNHGGRIELSLGTRYHGAIGTKLVHRDSGLDFVAASAHIRPSVSFASNPAAGKRDDIRKVIALFKKYPRVIIGGDWNTTDVFDLFAEAGYLRATPKGATTDKGKSLDAIFVKGFDIMDGAIIPTDTSDHHGLKALVVPSKL